MWKDKRNSQNIGYAYPSVLSQYLVEGLNQDRLINLLRIKGIALFDVKKQSPSLMSFCISVKQDKKFFAILKDLCYNKCVKVKKRHFFQRKGKNTPSDNVIVSKTECGYTVKKVGVRGKARWLYFLSVNLGLVFGAISFTGVCVYNADVIRKIEFKGSGSVLQAEILCYLQECGVSVNGRFSNYDLATLSDGVLASNGYLTFAECYKRGNSLVVNVALAKDKVNVLEGNVKALYSDVCGTVEQLRVYRGTALVNVGDRVQEGTLLVDGFATVKEQTLQVNVIASVLIRAEKTFQYTFDRDDQTERALLNARLDFDCQTTVDEVVKVEKSSDAENYLYLVTLYYSRAITVG